MFHGMGATNDQHPQGTCDSWLNWKDPFCIDFYLSGGNTKAVQTPLSPVITQAYVDGSAPAVPAEGYDSGTSPGGGSSAQSASDTIDGILAQSQANAVAAANAAAIAQAGGMPSTDTFCTQGSDKYNSALCWLSQHSGLVFTTGLVMMGLTYLMPSSGRRRR